LPYSINPLNTDIEGKSSIAKNQLGISRFAQYLSPRLKRHTQAQARRHPTLLVAVQAGFDNLHTLLLEHGKPT
jgi:hypothetical protein